MKSFSLLLVLELFNLLVTICPLLPLIIITMNRILIFMFRICFKLLVSFLLFPLTMLLRESYGEDIAETETEKSENSEVSEYDGSFINVDEDPQIFPSSPESSAGSGCMSHLTPLNSLHFLFSFNLVLSL